MTQKTTVCWFEIGCSDMPRATTFYGKLFGWEFKPFGDSSYQMIGGLDTKELGGALFQRKEPALKANEAGTVVTFRCDDVTKTLREAIALGAKLVQEKTQISPEMGYAGQFEDVEGNRVGLWSQN